MLSARACPPWKRSTNSAACRLCYKLWGRLQPAAGFSPHFGAVHTFEFLGGCFSNSVASLLRGYGLLGLAAIDDTLPVRIAAPNHRGRVLQLAPPGVGRGVGDLR